jgi:hypothetical protein
MYPSLFLFVLTQPIFLGWKMMTQVQKPGQGQLRPVADDDDGVSDTTSHSMPSSRVISP